MKLNKLVLLFFTFVCSFTNANENNTAFEKANTAYKNGDYKSAITLYSSIIDNELEAADIYYNLGNCYYKTNNIGLSILNYERAKRLDPINEDIAFNLKIANKKTEDKIDVMPQLFLSQWKNDFVHQLTEKGWSILSIVIIVSSLLLFVLYIKSSNRNTKQIGFFGGSILLILSIFLFFTAKQKYHLSKNNKKAIIVSPSTTASGSPNIEGTQLFILHEGTKVSINKEDSNWSEIVIANGNTGWIKNENMEGI